MRLWLLEIFHKIPSHEGHLEKGFRSSCPNVWVSSLPATSCVTLGDELNLYRLQYLHLSDRDKHSL